MDTNALKKFAQAARTQLIDQVTSKLAVVLDPASDAFKYIHNIGKRGIPFGYKLTATTYLLRNCLDRLCLASAKAVSYSCGRLSTWLGR